MDTTGYKDFEKLIEQRAHALRDAVRYSGAVSAAKAPAKSVPFFSRPAAQLAGALAAALIIGGSAYFMTAHFKNNIVHGPGTADTSAASSDVTNGFETEPYTESEGSAAAPGTDTDPADTSEPETVSEPEATTEPETDETKTQPAPSETTEPETTATETTVPDTTIPQTTEPETTADTVTEKPVPGEQVAPAPEDKNGYKLFVNHIDVTNITNFGVDDVLTVLPFSTILNFFENGSAAMTGSGTFTLAYESDTFTLNVLQYTMTGNHYSGNWFENKQTETKALYVADGILYADAGTVSAFLSEFAGGAVKVDKDKKTVTAMDFYYDEDTRHIPVLNENPGTFSKNGYKLYINGNNVTQKVNYDVSADGEATMPFAETLRYLGHCEVTDFGSYDSIHYDGAVYTLQATNYKLTGDGIDGNWFTGKSTLFMAFCVKNKTLYSDLGFINDFLSDFAGGCAVIDHDKKTIEIKDKYYEEEKPGPVVPDGTKYDVPFSDGVFCTITHGGDNEATPGRTRIDFYVPAKDDDDRLVRATYVTFPDGSCARIVTRRKTNGATELFFFCEYSGETDDGDYSYEAFAYQIEIYNTVYNPDAFLPYANTVSGKRVSFTYTDDTKDRITALKQKDYAAVEALVPTLESLIAEPDQYTDTSVSPLIICESGMIESSARPYDSSDPFVLTAGSELFR